MAARRHRLLNGTVKGRRRHAVVGGEEADNSSPGGTHAEFEPRLGNGATQHRRLDLTGERRPFLAAAKAYLDDVRPYYRAITLEQARRDLTTIERDLRALRRAKRIRTMNPERLGEEDVRELLLLWQTRPGRDGRPLDTSTQAHYLNTFRNLVGWCGNPVLDVMRRRKHVRFPRQIAKRVHVLESEELARLRSSADGIPGWPGTVARFLVVFLPGTGLRPKEIRLARLEDLDANRWSMRIAHPKGEGTWAAAGDEAPVLPFARQGVLDFLEERRTFLDGDAHEALIPYRRWNGSRGQGRRVLDYWPAAMLRKLKGELEELSGVAFSLKTFRATFAQMAKDRDVSIEAVSRAMRHGSTKTTEKFYARIRADDAFRALYRAFETPELHAK